MRGADSAETSRLAYALARVGESLDRLQTDTVPDAWSRQQIWRKALDQPLPTEGIGLEAVLDELEQYLIPNGTPLFRKGFSGFITTAPTTVAVAAASAAMLAAPQRQMLHAFNFVEELSLDWLSLALDLPRHMRGVYTSGGSAANLVALGAARQRTLERHGVDPAAHGMSRPCAIYASSETHHTIRRAAGVLGIGRANVRAIAVDGRGRMQGELLRERIAEDREHGIVPVAVVGNAGSTDTGSIDKLAELAEIAHQNQSWFHVDGAYGLFGVLDPAKKALYEGLERADSVIVDPHKWMGAPVGVGAVFVRDREILLRAFTQEPAHYLEGTQAATAAQHSLDSLGLAFADMGLELSSPPRGVIVWAMLREIGVEGLRARIVRHNLMARRVAERAKAHPRLQLLREPVLSVCCFRYLDPRSDDHDALNRAIHRQLLQENEHLPSTTMVDGALAIRPCFIGARTGFEYADGLVDAVLRIGDSLVA